MTKRTSSREGGLRLGSDFRIPPVKHALPVTMSTKVRICSNRCAPRWLHHVCCFFTMRLFTTWFTVDSTRPVIICSTWKVAPCRDRCIQQFTQPPVRGLNRLRDIPTGRHCGFRPSKWSAWARTRESCSLSVNRRFLTIIMTTSLSGQIKGYCHGL
jgi:hypothetical protein